MASSKEYFLVLTIASYIAIEFANIYLGVFNTIFLAGLIWLLLFSYSGLIALRVRKALFVPIYKKQALSVAIVGLGWAVIAVVSTFFFYLSAGNLGFDNYIAGSVELFAFTILFYWIDSVATTSRRADPLLRDSLKWSHLRIVIWVIVLGGTMINASLYFVFGPTLGGPFSFGYNIYAIEAIVRFVLTPLVGTLLIWMVYRRTKDILLRDHLKWLEVLLILLFFGTLLFELIAPLNTPRTYEQLFFANSVLYVSFFGACYCLYRGATSLAPVNRRVMNNIESATQ
jgi:hypothetical protein